MVAPPEATEAITAMATPETTGAIMVLGTMGAVTATTVLGTTGAATVTTGVLGWVIEVLTMAMVGAVGDADRRARP